MLNNKLIFDFEPGTLKIQARVKKNKIGYSVVEIIKVKEKKINVNEIMVHHPSFEDQEYSRKTKLRTYHKINSDSDRAIDNNVDGSNDSDESIDTEIISHEYVNMPNVIKEKTGYRDKRINEDENTKKYILDDNSRTLSDSEGLNLAKGIEISNVDVGQVNGELKEFINVLNLLEKINGIRSIDYNIVYLPLGRKFSYLNNGITRRQCIIAQIVKSNGNKYRILEIERQEKSLSTLVLIENKDIHWNYVYKKILEGLVNESGKWSNKVFEILKLDGIFINRIKHTSKSNYKKAIFIYSKLI